MVESTQLHEQGRLARPGFDIDEVLLPGERKYTFTELAERGGVPADELSGWWTAAGFPDLSEDDEKAFTDDDVSLVRDLADTFAISKGREALVPAAQSLGQALSRLAEWQAALIRHQLQSTPDSDNTDPAAQTALIVDRLDTLQSNLWRRHLSTAARRLMTRTEDESRTYATAVGFADMVGYTRLSRGLAVEELNTLVTTFENRMHAVIHAGGGWIVKGVGDEVMFAADDPVAAAHIALELQEPHSYPELDAIDLSFPALRVGVAYGDVLARFGDLFGNVVNLASRLTSAARPGTVLVDANIAAAVKADPQLRTTSLRPYRARGFNQVHPYLLRAARG